MFQLFQSASTSTGNATKITFHTMFSLTCRGTPTNMTYHSKYAVTTKTTKVTATLKTSSAAQDVHIFPAKKKKEKGKNVSYFSCGLRDGCVTQRPQVQEKQQAIMERTVKIADGEERRSTRTSGTTGKDLWWRL